jgi:hypothetical protein
LGAVAYRPGQPEPSKEILHRQPTVLIEHIVGPTDYPTDSGCCFFRATTAKNLQIGSSHIAQQQPASHAHLLIKELASATLTKVIDRLK